MNKLSSPAPISLWPATSGQSPADELLIDPETHGPHNRHVRNVTYPRLHAFLPDTPCTGRPACIICPGGGYYLLALDKEGHDVAQALCNAGIAAFTLVYRLPDGTEPMPGSVPVPIQDVRHAIRLVRSIAAEWNINPNQIGVMGFSAGGHLAATAATQFDAGDGDNADPVARQSSRPDFAALIYPVISMHKPITNEGTCFNLLGPSPSFELKQMYSADVNITAGTPPLFLVHAQDDLAVPIENSLKVVEAAAAAGVSCELMRLETGGHGFGLGVNGGEPVAWPPRCIEWIKKTAASATVNRFAEFADA